MHEKRGEMGGDQVPQQPMLISALPRLRLMTWVSNNCSFGFSFRRLEWEKVNGNGLNRKTLPPMCKKEKNVHIYTLPLEVIFVCFIRRKRNNNADCIWLGKDCNDMTHQLSELANSKFTWLTGIFSDIPRDWNNSILHLEVCVWSEQLLILLDFYPKNIVYTANLWWHYAALFNPFKPANGNI